MLSHHTNHALACLQQIPTCVLRPCSTRAEADDEDGRIVVYDLEVAERRKVALTIFRKRTDEGNRTWNGGDKEAVVLDEWRCSWVELDM